MVIGKSQLNMESARAFKQVGTSIRGVLSNVSQELTKQTSSVEYAYSEKKSVNGDDKIMAFDKSLDTASKKEAASEMDKAALGGKGFNLNERRMLQVNKSSKNSERISAKRVREQTLLYLLLRLRRMLMGEEPSKEINNQLPNEELMPELPSDGNNTLGYRIDASGYEETETTEFQAGGRVVTKDGREIDFNIALSMTRRFYQAVENISQIKGVPVENLVDPIVINLDDNPATVSDQKFKFDLDMDGKEDNISMPGKGSGFLALDLNNDGVINDGGELFGTKSGNGFKDLALYDEDGNGWIDEADEIFDRLLIWTKDEDGNDSLVKLKDLNIGALCLENVKTDFSLKDDEYRTEGIIRHTGFFLYENGRAGTMQHLDLAT